MNIVSDRPEGPSAIQTDLHAIFVSLELSRSSWVITSLSPGAGEKMSRRSVKAGEVSGLLERLALLKEKARSRTGTVFPILVVQEAGVGAFCVPPLLGGE